MNEEADTKNGRTGIADVVAEIEKAMKAGRWSGREASRAIGATPEFVRNLKRGHGVMVGRVRDLCETLGMEFYVGAPRNRTSVDAKRLEQAIEALENALATAGRTLDANEKARAATAIYALIGAGGRSETEELVKTIVNARTTNT